MNISEFISWFLNQFVTIGTFAVNKLDQIYLVANVSILDFMITITIITAFIKIIISRPNTEPIENRVESRKKFLESEERRYEQWWNERR